jgi:alpha-L-rhamnosidase
VAVCYLLFGYKAYEYYGDADTLKTHYEGYKRWTEYLTDNLGGDGATLYSRYGDWCPPGDYGIADAPVSRDTPGGFVSAVYYLLHLRYLSKIAAILKKTEDEAEYARRAEATKTAVIKKYYDERQNVFATGSQSCQALALNCGLFAPDKAESAAAALANEIVRCGYHIYAGNQAYRHLFETLTHYGYADVVYRALVNPEYPGWGYMAACGATSVWERWEDEMQLVMHSFCHPMFASYDAWLYNDVLGIKPAPGAAGFDKILIRPAPLAALDNAGGYLDTPCGRVSCSWTRRGKTVEYLIAAPPNTSATVRIDGITHVDGAPFCGDVVLEGGGKVRVSAQSGAVGPLGIYSEKDDGAHIGAQSGGAE